MTSEPGKQTIAIHYCPIYLKKWMQSDNEFCRLIEYNMRYSFLEKSYIKSGGQTIPRPFFEKSKLKICLDQ